MLNLINDSTWRMQELNATSAESEAAITMSLLQDTRSFNEVGSQVDVNVSLARRSQGR